MSQATYVQEGCAIDCPRQRHQGLQAVGAERTDHTEVQAALKRGMPLGTLTQRCRVVQRYLIPL